MKQKRILLHTCCAPCSSYVYELLKDDYKITPYFFNPNIAPREEFTQRLEEMRYFSAMKGMPLIVGEYDLPGWTARVRPHRFEGEKSERCFECYRFRLEGTYEQAAALDMDQVGTVLSISPHKNAEMINAIGTDLGQRYGIPFLEANFKKQEGFKKSSDLSRYYGFYRQDYCGCVYSRMERDRNSEWSQRVMAHREESKSNSSS